MRFFLLTVIFAVTCARQIEAQQSAQPEQKVIGGTVLLNGKTAPDATVILTALKKDWKIKTDSASTADKTIVFAAPGATVMIAFLDYPVSPGEIQTAARISWLWKGSGAEAGRHQSQVVISVIGTGKTLDLYKLFTKIAACVLENTDACGIYMADQYLLLSKGFYTAAARNMLDNFTIPLYCWVNFGMAREEEFSSAYSFGLQEFGLHEMEIVQSKQSLQDTHAVLYDAAMTVVRNNIRLKDGETFTTGEGQKLTVRLSKAAFQEGETLKIGY